MSPRLWMARQESCSLLANDFGDGVCSFSAFQRNKPCFGVSYFIAAACDACSGESDYNRENGCGTLNPAPSPLPVGESALPSWALVMASATPAPVTFNLAQASVIASSLAQPTPPPPPPPTHPIITVQETTTTTVPPKSNDFPLVPSTSTPDGVVKQTQVLESQTQPSPPPSTSSHPAGASQTNSSTTVPTSSSTATSASNSLAASNEVSSSSAAISSTGIVGVTHTPNVDPNHAHISSLSKPHLPSGVIAGIVLAVAAVMALAGFFVLRARRRRQKMRRRAVEQFTALKESWSREHGETENKGSDVVPLGVYPFRRGGVGFAGVGIIGGTGKGSTDLPIETPSSTADTATPTTARPVERRHEHALLVDEKKFPMAMVERMPDRAPDNATVEADVRQQNSTDEARVHECEAQVELRESWFSFSEMGSEPLPQYFEEERRD
ncbi:hypothetical protein FB45DRAFT_1130988 [Roridomyces roridus]|uniref:Uncharacterized protein n=1 Tax=Roridomyces roridus TaxID=1738132 RepID=A0AAD7B1M3_9AGAR|nr:hypothetical protein FB45DRAFT_1130988 [Roridomyces roridus]